MASLLVASLVCAVATAKTLGPVVGGYDVVEFHHLQPSDVGVKGNSNYSYNLLTQDTSTDTSKKMDPTNWTFYFKDAVNLQMFVADPFKYTPRYGGF